jgi:hypothetical protein
VNCAIKIKGHLDTYAFGLAANPIAPIIMLGGAGLVAEKHDGGGVIVL